MKKTNKQTNKQTKRKKPGILPAKPGGLPARGGGGEGVGRSAVVYACDLLIKMTNGHRNKIADKIESFKLCKSEFLYRKGGYFLQKLFRCVETNIWFYQPFYHFIELLK